MQELFDVAYEADLRGDVEGFKEGLRDMLEDPEYDYHFTLELFENSFPIDLEDLNRRAAILSQGKKVRRVVKYIDEDVSKIDPKIKFNILADCMFEAKKEIELDTFLTFIPIQRNDIFRELLERIAKSGRKVGPSIVESMIVLDLLPEDIPLVMERCDIVRSTLGREIYCMFIDDMLCANSILFSRPFLEELKNLGEVPV